MCWIKLQSKQLFVSPQELSFAQCWIWSWAGESCNQKVAASLLLRIEVPTDYAYLQTNLANCQTGLLFEGNIWLTGSSWLTWLSISFRHKSHISQVWLQFGVIVLTNQTTCEVAAPALIMENCSCGFKFFCQGYLISLDGVPWHLAKKLDSYNVAKWQ